MTSGKMSWRRRIFFSLVLVCFSAAVAFAIGEVLVTIFRPVPYMYPRYKYSPQYGFTLYESTRMVHGWPRKFKFHYTVNEYGYRGAAIDPSTATGKPTIVVLGDSYTFGIGVEDGEPYPAVLETELGYAYNVVNLGTPGWGLTQHIRRYFEFGRLYHPKIVILQFCSNDPEDNLNNMVTRITSDDFEFVDAAAGVHRVKKYLSHSIIQRSQLYNLYRGRVYEFFQNRNVAEQDRQLRAVVGREVESMAESPTPRELFYCELLDLFARKLEADGVRLIMIAVDGFPKSFAHIEGCVRELDDGGYLTYVDVDSLIRGVRARYSPEGHWGAGSHRAIAAGLASRIQSGN